MTERQMHALFYIGCAAMAARAEPCPHVTGTTTRYCTLTPFTLTDEERLGHER